MRRNDGAHQSALTITTARDLAQPMSDEAREYAAASKAQNTLRAYRAAWAEFRAFADQRGAVALPAQNHIVVEYITAPAESGARVLLSLHARRRMRFLSFFIIKPGAQKSDSKF